MTAAILINGVTPADPLHAVAVEDRGFQYGDGVFESALLTHGRVRLLEQHLSRLALGCERLGIAAPDAAALRSDVQRLSGSARRAMPTLPQPCCGHWACARLAPDPKASDS